ncbi:MAG: SLBB domain-containing protein [Bacteroidales bacterium]|nr:SLBB domain-containing protein [Bacteroidales bacterium]
MIKKLILSAFAIFCSAGMLMAQSTMSDQQVLDYTKAAVAKGKSYTEIAKELALKGVTRTQAERVKKLYESQQDQKEGTNKKQTNRQITRNDSTYTQQQQLRTPALTTKIKKPIPAETKDRLVYSDADTTSTSENDEVQIFGREIFQNRDLNFMPSENLATPENYRLGPGDEVIIDIFGANQTTLRDDISPEGSINVDILGPIYLNGLTIEQANTFLKQRLSSIYAGLTSEGEQTDIRLSLGQIRSIMVNVLGEVANPGTYNISSFSTVLHALYTAGGVMGVGSLRDIKVVRNGKTVSSVDIYDLLINGSRQNDIRLEEGDVILIPAYKCLVEARGKVKRPMFFEMKEGESLEALINYAGGYDSDAYTQSLTVIRQNGKEYEVYSVDNNEYGTFVLKNGDEVEVGELLSRFNNRVKIDGAVYRKGLYQLGGKVTTVKSLIEKADGLLPEAFTTRAILHREKTDRSLEVLSVDLAGILNGTAPDIPLRNNDVLFVPSIYDLKDQGTLTIYGEVAKPGVFKYAGNTTLEDLILQAGGLLESASTAQVDVARRVKNTNSLTAQSEIAETYSFSLKNGFVIEGEPGFILKPYDEVFVRTSPSYSEQQHVTVTGEVNFTGQFAMSEREQRISSIIKRAGGITDFAYTRGARLARRMTEEEITRAKEKLETLEQSGDSLKLDKKIEEYYYVGINLDKALANPGSDYDIVLRDGDRIEIPTYNNTVKISGTVLYPNTVTYDKKLSINDYIKMAGGYAQDANKKKVYVISMNGMVSKGRKYMDIEPGSEIVVPMKKKRSNTLQETMAIATTATSLATTIAAITALFK